MIRASSLARLAVRFKRASLPALAMIAIGVWPRSAPLAEPSKASCPEGMVLVNDRLCIDAFEASLEEIDPSGAVLGPHSPYEQVGKKRVRAVSKRGVVPQAYIDQTDAKAACLNAGKRLCTNEEWLGACKGTPATRYPYGERRRAGYCNDQGTEALPFVFPGKNDEWFRTDRMNDPRLDKVPGSLAKTGSFPLCRGDQEIFDMVGNLHEWTADDGGTMRGGFYLDTHALGDGCDYVAIGHDTLYHDYSTGFRCCADARTP
jgi:sulfatase modifying factor 1